MIADTDRHMRRRRESFRLEIALLAGALAFACQGSTPQAPTSAAAPTPRFETAHFRIQAEGVPDAMLHEMADRLEAALPRVLIPVPSTTWCSAARPPSSS